MLKKYFIMAITAIFALVACSEKFDEPGMLPAGSDNVHTLSVGIEAGTYTPAEGETKASMEAVIRVNWTKDDEVSVVNATKGKILGGSLKAKESGTSVTFEGTVTGTIDNGDRLYYIYPKLNNTEETDFADAGYDQKLSDQKYDATKPNEVCFFGYAEDVAGTATISKKIQFNLVTAYAHLNMSNLPAKGAPLTSIDVSNVNEGFTWKLSNKNLSAEPYVGNNGISVTCTNYNITQAGNAVARFALPASAASQQARVITVNNAYKNKNYTKAELLSSSYHNQLYTSWESNVSITPQTDKTEVSIGNEGSTEVAEGVLPVAEAFENGKKTEIGMGGIGKITFDETATEKIKSNAGSAGSTEVFFKVEDVTETKPVENADLVYEVTMKTVDEQGVEVFSTEKAAGVATVTVPLGEEVEEVTSVALVNDSGTIIAGGVVPDSDHFENGILTFQVNHFSKYAISYTKRTQPITAVAQIGNSKYTTLENAVAAAQNGNTIQMSADFETTDKVTVGADKNIILDLNGKKISYTTDGYESFIENRGQLKVKDSGSNGIITAKFNNPNWNAGCYTINNAGTYDKAGKLVIESGTIENTSPGEGLAWPISNGIYGTNADLVINGGTIHSTNYVPVREYLQCGGKKTIVINGGKFISDNSRAIAVQVNDATIQDTGSSVTINGGEFTCNGSGILYVDMHAANANLSGFSMIVNGGKFKNSNTDAPVLVYDYEGKDHDSVVLLSKILKGGTYSKEPASELLADGYELVDNQDAGYPYKVQQKPFVAKIGETGYFSFADAVEAVQANQTIEVLSNIALDSPITISKSGITIDGKGKTIAVSDVEYWNQYKVNGDNQGLGKRNMISVSADNFTLKNVTLNGKDCRGVSLCTTTGGKNVLYQNVTYTGRGSGHYYGEATGLVTFDGCKFDIHGYAIHFGGESSLDDDVVIKNCEVNGWSSFGKCKSLTISDSHFGGANDEGKNGWLAVLRPYCPTTITNCTFSDIYLHTTGTNYECIGLGTGAATTVILNGCKVVDDSKQVKADVDIYSIVRDNAFDNDAAQNGSVFAFDAEGNATDGFKSGTFYAKDPVKIKLQSGHEYYVIEGKTNIYGIREKVVANQTEFETACAAAKSGDKIVLGNGEFAIGPVDINGKTLTFKGQGAANTKIYIGNGGYDGNGGHGSNKTANMTFEDVTLDDLASDAGYLTGFTEAAGLTFRNVTFEIGFSNWGNKGGDVSFFNCTFNQNTAEKYNVQELRSANNTHYLFDGCTFNSAPGRFINAYKQGGESTNIEIIVKNCSFSGTEQAKAAVNLKSGSNGCSINCYFLGRNTVNNVKVQHEATGSALFADQEGTCAKVYVGASKETAVLIWENQAKTSNYIQPESYNPQS